MDRTIDLDTGRLFYRIEGRATGPLSGPASRAASAGAPLVLIHGFAEDGRIWEQQIAGLKDRFRLLIPDLPGSGLSSPLKEQTSMEAMAEAIAAMLDAEHCPSAILVGHSMGGYIALAFAEKYPARLRAFGLFHSTAFPDTEEKKALRRKSNEFIRKRGAAPFIQQSTPNLFADNTRENRPDLVERIVDRYSSFDPGSLIRYYEAMIARPDRTRVLKSTGSPVLFVIGEHDQTIPLESSLQQAHMPAIAAIHILSRTGHMGMLEDPEGSNAILTEFLGLEAVNQYQLNDQHT